MSHAGQKRKTADAPTDKPIDAVAAKNRKTGTASLLITSSCSSSRERERERRF
jgi:hypothetical protein